MQVLGCELPQRWANDILEHPNGCHGSLKCSLGTKFEVPLNLKMLKIISKINYISSNRHIWEEITEGEGEGQTKYSIFQNRQCSKPNVQNPITNPGEVETIPTTTMPRSRASCQGNSGVFGLIKDRKCVCIYPLVQTKPWLLLYIPQSLTEKALKIFSMCKNICSHLLMGVYTSIWYDSQWGWEELVHKSPLCII